MRCRKKGTRQSNCSLVKLLLEAKASVNAVDSQQMTPLHLCLAASEESDMEVACGARVDGLQSKAEWNGRLGSVIGPSVPSTERSVLRWPVLIEGNQEGVMLKAENLSRVHLETADSLLKARADVNLGNLQWGEGRTFLHEAAHMGDVDMSKRALLGGADINRKDKMGFSPLHLAVRARRSEVIRLLVESKADLQQQTVTLRKPKDDVWACATRRCWAWKERLLGDGHDFFIPRPKTTRRLCGWLRSTATEELPVEEVAILGNCKRFDIYVALAQPVEAHQAVAVEPLAVDAAQESWQLQRSLELRSGDAVTRYACSVAMALEGRTRTGMDGCWDGRLQLKRSLEAATGGDDAPCGRRLLCIWRMALEAGKALRAAAEPLPRGLAYAEAERLLAAQVVKCQEKLRGFRQGGAVAQLRASAMELLESEEWEDPSRARRRVQRLLHEPSVALKAGMATWLQLEVNETKILQEAQGSSEASPSTGTKCVCTVLERRYRDTEMKSIENAEADEVSDSRKDWRARGHPKASRIGGSQLVTVHLLSCLRRWDSGPTPIGGCFAAHGAGVASWVPLRCSRILGL
eukprot:s406_g11.t5